jgi:hypothetical protein
MQWNNSATCHWIMGSYILSCMLSQVIGLMNSQKHLAYMLETTFTKPQRVFFNSVTSPVAAVDYLAELGVDILSGRGTIWDARRGRTTFSV